MNARLGLLATLALSVLVAACSGSGPGESPGTPPSGGPEISITSPEEAAARVIASDPRFREIERRDRDMIGQGSWWDAEATTDGFRVMVEIGWGDCPAGCINRHDWVIDVAPDGTLAVVSETGPPLPAGGF